MIADVLASLRAATEYGRSWGKAWHHWALFNAAAMEHYAKTCPAQAIRHVAPAVSGFFRSIALEGARRGGRDARPLACGRTRGPTPGRGRLGFVRCSLLYKTHANGCPLVWCDLVSLRITTIVRSSAEAGTSHAGNQTRDQSQYRR